MLCNTVVYIIWLPSIGVWCKITYHSLCFPAKYLFQITSILKYWWTTFANYLTLYLALHRANKNKNPLGKFRGRILYTSVVHYIEAKSTSLIMSFSTLPTVLIVSAPYLFQCWVQSSPGLTSDDGDGDGDEIAYLRASVKVMTVGRRYYGENVEEVSKFKKWWERGLSGCRLWSKSIRI